jgi:hypothetical protein
MTTTPSDDYDTAGLVSSRDGQTPENSGLTPGPGAEGSDLGEDDEQKAKHAAAGADQLNRTPGVGPDGSDLGEAPEDVGRVRRAHAAKHAADQGTTAERGPGPEGTDVDR